MQEAVDCFNSKKYEESKKLFKTFLKNEITLQQKVEAYNYLQKIHVIYQTEFTHFEKTEYLGALFKLGEYSSFYENYKILNTDNILTDLECIDALYKLGEIQNCLNVSKKTCLKVVEKKYYNHSKDVFSKIEMIFKNYVFYDFGFLISSIETGDYENSIVRIKKIIEKTVNHWSDLEGKKKTSLEYVKHLYSLVDGFNIVEANFSKALLKIKAETCFTLNEMFLTQREFLEFLVAFEDEKELYFLIARIIPDEFVGYDILDYLKKNEIEDRYNYKKKSIRAYKKIKSEQKEKIEEIDLRVTDVSTKVLNSEREKIFLKYGVRNTTEYIIDKEKIINLSDSQKEDIVLSLISLEYYDDAELVSNMIRNPKNKLKSKINLLKSKRDIKALIAYLVPEINEISKSEEQLDLLLFLKDAFLEIEDKVSAENLESLIAANIHSLADIEKGLKIE